MYGSERDLLEIVLQKPLVKTSVTKPMKKTPLTGGAHTIISVMI
jgi:hypothetical protein